MASAIRIRGAGGGKLSAFTGRWASAIRIREPVGQAIRIRGPVGVSYPHSGSRREQAIRIHGAGGRQLPAFTEPVSGVPRGVSREAGWGHDVRGAERRACRSGAGVPSRCATRRAYGPEFGGGRCAISRASIRPIRSSSRPNRSFMSSRRPSMRWSTPSSRPLTSPNSLRTSPTSARSSRVWAETWTANQPAIEKIPPRSAGDQRPFRPGPPIRADRSRSRLVHLVPRPIASISIGPLRHLMGGDSYGVVLGSVHGSFSSGWRRNEGRRFPTGDRRKSGAILPTNCPNVKSRSEADPESGRSKPGASCGSGEGAVSTLRGDAGQFSRRSGGYDGGAARAGLKTGGPSRCVTWRAYGPEFGGAAGPRCATGARR